MRTSRLGHVRIMHGWTAARLPQGARDTGGTLKITVTAGEPKEDQIAAHITVDAKDVDAAIAKAYKDISHKYSFQGFRKGHTPRPVIDNMVGRDSVIAQATNDLINDVEPLMLEELDVVPVEEPSYGEEPPMLEEHKPYEVDAVIKLRPACELESYDAPTIDMPPAEVTDAEIDEQIDQLQSYHTTFEDIEEDRAVEEGDILSVDIDDVENAQAIAGKNHMLALDGQGLPEEFDEQLVGMKKGESKEISWTSPVAEGAEPVKSTCKVTLNAIKQKNVPELTDDFVKKGYGFGSVAELRDAVKGEIESDKKQSLPNLKEDRVIEDLAKRLKLEQVPETYGNQVFNELAQTFLTQLQRQGMTLDGFLQARHIAAEDFIADLHKQADERARQSLALDSLARKLNLEVTDDDIEKEFSDAGVENVKASVDEFLKDGRMPSIRDSIKRSKALTWLVDNAQVNEVDEVAERRNAAATTDSESAAKKAATTTSAKKPAAEKDAPEKDAE